MTIDKTISQDAARKLRKALLKIHGWLVCAAITSPEDMAQSFADMEETARLAIAAAEGSDK